MSTHDIPETTADSRSSLAAPTRSSPNESELNVPLASSLQQKLLPPSYLGSSVELAQGPARLDSQHAAFTLNAENTPFSPTLVEHLHEQAAGPRKKGWVQTWHPNGEDRPRLSLFSFVTLTLILLGLQMCWVVELSYGTNFLTSLGVVGPLTAIVWMAGPLSGFIMQPLVGVLTDRCRSKLGLRTPAVIIGSLLTTLSLFLICFSRVAGGTEENGHGTNLAKGMAITGFVALDFFVNIVQAAARALILDVPNVAQQDVANAFASGMVGAGSLIGNLIAIFDLPAVFGTKATEAPKKQQGEFGLDDLQMLILSFLAVSAMIFCASITVVCHHPSRASATIDDSDANGNAAYSGSKPRDVLSSMFKPLIELGRNAKRLPRSIKFICGAQLLSWVGWFPVLFYGPTYVVSYVDYKDFKNDDKFKKQKLLDGSLATLLMAAVALFCTLLLPLIRKHVYRYSLVDLWIATTAIFVLTSELTFIVSSYEGAVAIIALMGVPWAITVWVPIALIGQLCALQGQQASPTVLANSTMAPNQEDTISSRYVSNRFATLRNKARNGLRRGAKTSKEICETSSVGDAEEPGDAANESHVNADSTNGSLPAGTILGIHNVCVVLPQLLISLVLATVLWITGEQLEVKPGIVLDSDAKMNNVIAWIFRGCAAVSAIAILLQWKLRQYGRI